MDTVAKEWQESSNFLIVCDERCPVVRNLGSIVKWWDKRSTFTFVDRDSTSQKAKDLVQELDQSQWSLLLVDEFDRRWSGPEAIPIILKNLSGGKIAAVLYILPGTMWLTNQLYNVISRNRKIFSPSRLQHQ
ncbi:MAG: DUF393 domain-containing protein [Cyanobacteria bacterium]|nr:DUF393 domain-containing protein [Cyanobacteriota bacterium]